MQQEQKIKLAEIIGCAFGDGSLVTMGSGKQRFQLRGHMTEDREHYENFIIPVFNEVISMPLTGNPVGKVLYQKRNSFGIATESRMVVKFLLEHGVPLGTKNELLIPPWIKSDVECLKAFLRGLVDTDGSVYCSKQYTGNDQRHKVIRIDIGTTSKKFITDIYFALKNIGFHPYLLKPQIKKKQNERTGYKIKISKKSDIEKWNNEIGFSNPKHETKYLIWKYQGFCPAKTTIAQRKGILENKINMYSFYPLHSAKLRA